MVFPTPNKVNIEKIHCMSSDNINIYMKREDMIHPLLSGNKYWKLKYNYLEALKQNKDSFISFGGAYSNHLYAVAALGNITKTSTIGIVRGEELEYKWKENPTLSFCVKMGMKLFFIDRNNYRLKENSLFVQEIISQFPNSYLIPEGGTNNFAIKGVSEILTADTEKYNFICSAIGTGGTIAGLSIKAKEGQKILGFSTLKNGGFLVDEIKKYTNRENFDVILPFHFGGYGKYNSKLIDFIEEFYCHTKIRLEPIYTAKMMYGIQTLIHENYFPKNSNILAIHTGGLQTLNNLSHIKFNT